MLAIDNYLDAAIARHYLRGDRHLALTLGLAGTAVNAWRTRRTWPEDATMVRLAALAGFDAKVALIDLNTWRAKSPVVRELYQAVRQALPALITAAFVTAALLAAPPAKAGTGWRAPSPIYTLCAWKWVRFTDLVRRIWDSIAVLFAAEPRVSP